MLSFREFSVLLFLSVVSLGLTVPEVHAQATAISDVHYPTHIIYPTLLDLLIPTPHSYSYNLISSYSHVIIEASVSYSGANIGYYLGIFVFDRDRPQDLTVSGTASSSPDSCIDTFRSGCTVRVPSTGGTEHIRFVVSERPPMGTWRLEVVAALFDFSNNILHGSSSYYEFSIDVRNTVSLTVRVPYLVKVMFDGANQTPGNAFLDVSPGSHSISVPSLVQVDNGTRLRFDHWTDGVSEASRTVNLQDDATYEAVYVKQYVVTSVSSQGSPSGFGWFDEGSSAKLSLPATVSMAGPLGLLGGKWVFQGWYENGKMLTTSNNASIMMDKAHVVTAHWSGDYTIPAVIVGVIVAAAVGGLFGYRRYMMDTAKVRPRRRRARKATVEEAATPQPPPAQLERTESVEEPGPATVVRGGGPRKAEVRPTKVFCRYCGAEIEEDSVFCKQCGKKLT